MNYYSAIHSIGNMFPYADETVTAAMVEECACVHCIK